MDLLTRHVHRRGKVCDAALRLLGILALLVALRSPLAAQTPSDEKEILRLEDNWCVALKTQDATLLNEILADDYVEVTSSGSIESRSAVMAALKDPRGSTTSCGNSGIKVRIYGNAAVATGVMDQAVTSNGVPYSGKRIIFTDTYIRQGGRWKCVAGQSTVTTGPK
jgi:hypothetical protein